MQLISKCVADAINEDIAAADETLDTRYYLEDYFKQKPGINGDMTIDPAADDAAALAAYVIANKDFEILGTNGVTANVTFHTTNAGLLLTTAGANADQVIIAPHLDTGETAWTNIKWGTENQVDWIAQVKTGAAITTEIIWAGLKLTNTSTIATDADQVFFRYSSGDGNTNWMVESSIGNTDTATNSGIAVVVNTQYKFRITIDAERKAHCYINDVLVYTTAALTNDVDLIPYVGIQASDTAAVTAVLNYEKISRILFE